MSNKKIIRVLKRILKFMELHGTNDFKIRGYQNAIQKLERVHQPIASMDEQALVSIDGIGQSIARTVLEVKETGTTDDLQAYLRDTPPGLVELMRFRGLGTKKLRTLWQDFGIIDKTSLKALIESGNLHKAKGFGEKTVNTLAGIVDFAFACEGKMLFAEAEIIGNVIIDKLQASFEDAQISFTGKLRRQWELVEAIEILTDIALPKLMTALADIPELEYDKKKSGPFSWKGQWTSDEIAIAVVIYPTQPENFARELLLKTGSPEHLNWSLGEKKFIDIIKTEKFANEQGYYKAAGLAYCAPEIREGAWEMPLAIKDELPELVTMADLKGILHNHTTYSDGQNTVMEMAVACQDLGYEYLGLSDHSKAANFYANGLFEESVAKQQAEIDQVNKELTPFRIFKGIEADILADGALDYDAETLKTFDFVVASIHSGLNMDKTKATERLLTAIANPFTTILGHMTGRLLLERQGYPVDHEAIINACAQYGVIIEINAHPKRLDIDWRWVRKALDKGVVLSINPDAHEIAGYKDMRYGVLTGRKGGLTREQTFNAWGLDKVEKYFLRRKNSFD